MTHYPSDDVYKYHLPQIPVSLMDAYRRSRKRGRYRVAISKVSVLWQMALQSSNIDNINISGNQSLELNMTSVFLNEINARTYERLSWYSLPTGGP